MLVGLLVLLMIAKFIGLSEHCLVVALFSDMYINCF